MKRRTFLHNTLVTSVGTVFIPSFFKNQPDLFVSDGIPALKTSINVKAPGQAFAHYWSKCVGAGRANEGLRASWLEQMKLSKELCGFEYCRFHGLFHDDMFVYKEVNGKPVYNWQYIDDLFDRMLEIGVRPFVELSFMPKALASTQNTTFWWKANSSPPKDYQKWGELVTNFTNHCISRYGLEEVKQWYFEVWNEPDLHGFWDGTKSQYFKLYQTSVQTIKAINKELKVGGPATSNFVPDERFAGETEDKTQQKTLIVKDVNTLEWRAVWVKDFLKYCQQENLPVDFVSTHPYPTDYAIDPETKKGGGRTRKVGATQDDLTWLKKTVAESYFPKAEIHLTEWSSSPSSRDPTHDSLQVAAYIIKVNLDCIGLTNSLSYWTFTDVFEEAGAGNSVFHGGFGLINYQGIAKPAFHAYRMLNQLGDEILHREEGMIVTRNSKKHKVVALLYHYPSEEKEAVNGNVEKELNMGTPQKFNLSLEGLQHGVTLNMETLDRDHGFAYSEWQKMGSPEPPSREQTRQLKQLAMAVKKETAKAGEKGVFTLERTLQPWTCILIKEA